VTITASEKNIKKQLSEGTGEEVKAGRRWRGANPWKQCMTLGLVPF
jgi:hypothetical protein